MTEDEITQAYAQSSNWVHVQKIPGCPHCKSADPEGNLRPTPNPEGLDNCPKCGIVAPPKETQLILKEVA